MMDGLTDRWRHQEGSDSSDDEQGGRRAAGGGYNRKARRTGDTSYATEAAPVNRNPANYTHTQNGSGLGRADVNVYGELEVRCGPLLNYKGLSTEGEKTRRWHGSVLIVTTPGQQEPELSLKCLGPTMHGPSNSMYGQPEHGYTNGYTNGHTNGYSGEHLMGDGPDTSYGDRSQTQSVRGVKLYADPSNAFWRFKIDIPLQEQEARWEYALSGLRFTSGSRNGSTRVFVVPAASQSMRIMFHSCNGFSVGTDVDAWNGPALWNDVLRVHEKKPFHVMIGGGDQIYNDYVRSEGPLKAWTDIGNPRRRREYPFGEKLRAACDDYYCHNYINWFCQEPFASANGQIAQINIWDDHDIIDGFGSYTDHFMKCAVFRGIGGVAFKYYCLFQQHIPPPVSTFTTDAPQTMHSQGLSGAGADPRQLQNTFVLQTKEEESCWIIGDRPGPYVEERSRSMYMQLGAGIAFLGIDARTERTRHQINYPDTYDLIFNRVQSELSRSVGGVRHLIVLLGVPIAYPRLAWLENILSSPIIGPIRFLNKRFGFGSGLFNKFDGGVDLLDDLDDHYTARQHKKERKDLILRLQAIARDHDVRVTIVSGDVHLAALGRFYSNPRLGIPSERDHRYMPNIVSSAITNKPPPKAIANLLAGRNKIHHLDSHTDETLMDLFDKDPGNSNMTVAANHSTMPSRNYAVIREASDDHYTNSGHANGTANGHTDSPEFAAATGKDGHSPLHLGEKGAGTKHSAASGLDSSGMVGSLDVTIRVEIDQSDPEGRTEGYGFSIPTLVSTTKHVSDF